MFIVKRQISIVICHLSCLCLVCLYTNKIRSFILNVFNFTYCNSVICWCRKVFCYVNTLFCVVCVCVNDRGTNILFKVSASQSNYFLDTLFCIGKRRNLFMTNYCEVKQLWHLSIKRWYIYIYWIKKKFKPNMFGFEALHPIHDDRSIAPQSLFLCHAWNRFLSAMYLTV